MRYLVFILGNLNVTFYHRQSDTTPQFSILNLVQKQDILALPYMKFQELNARKLFQTVLYTYLQLVVKKVNLLLIAYNTFNPRKTLHNTLSWLHAVAMAALVDLQDDYKFHSENLEFYFKWDMSVWNKSFMTNSKDSSNKSKSWHFSPNARFPRQGTCCMSALKP